MIICPNCSHQEFVGTLICSECGSRLAHDSPLPQTRASQPAEYIDGATKPPAPEGPDLTSGAILGLRIVSTGDVISLLGRSNYTLGRSGEGQAVIPDVDLIAYDAFKHGISRIHAELRLQSNGLHVYDLDSANGTLVNGRRLDPQQGVPLRHGDILQLGSLRLQIISRMRNLR